MCFIFDYVIYRRLEKKWIRWKCNIRSQDWCETKLDEKKQPVRMSTFDCKRKIKLKQVFHWTQNTTIFFVLMSLQQRRTESNGMGDSVATVCLLIRELCDQQFKMCQLEMCLRCNLQSNASISLLLSIEQSFSIHFRSTRVLIEM